MEKNDHHSGLFHAVTGEREGGHGEGLNNPSLPGVVNKPKPKAPAFLVRDPMGKETGVNSDPEALNIIQGRKGFSIQDTRDQTVRKGPFMKPIKIADDWKEATKDSLHEWGFKDLLNKFKSQKTKVGAERTTTSASSLASKGFNTREKALQHTGFIHPGSLKDKGVNPEYGKIADNPVGSPKQQAAAGKLLAGEKVLKSTADKTAAVASKHEPAARVSAERAAARAHNKEIYTQKYTGQKAKLTYDSISTTVANLLAEAEKAKGKTKASNPKSNIKPKGKTVKTVSPKAPKVKTTTGKTEKSDDELHAARMMMMAKAVCKSPHVDPADHLVAAYAKATFHPKALGKVEEKYDPDLRAAAEHGVNMAKNPGKAKTIFGSNAFNKRQADLNVPTVMRRREKAIAAKTHAMTKEDPNAVTFESIVDNFLEDTMSGAVGTLPLPMGQAAGMMRPEDELKKKKKKYYKTAMIATSMGAAGDSY